jgi:TRAP-type C4-dicarboxylate transport system substrate-binding protein
MKAALAAALLVSWSAWADPVTLRIGTPAPKGTAWARDFEDFRRDVQKGTNGDVDVKIYLGGVAGTEMEMRDRMEKGQLDGVVSGGPLCSKIMPTMRVMYIVGLFQSQEQTTYVLSQLKPTLEAEAHTAGYRLLTNASVGPIIIFSKNPVASMDDLKSTHLWSWDLNEPVIQMASQMGVNLVPMGLDEAAPAYDAGKTNGYTATPSAALAFQWFAQTKYLTNLPLGYLEGCLVAREQSLDQLSPDDQNAVRVAAAALGVRIDRDSERMTETLVGGAFQAQGIQQISVSEKFAADFYAAARDARDKLGEKLVSKDVLGKVMTMLADYNAEHAGGH